MILNCARNQEEEEQQLARSKECTTAKGKTCIVFVLCVQAHVKGGGGGEGGGGQPQQSIQ